MKRRIGLARTLAVSVTAAGALTAGLATASSQAPSARQTGWNAMVIAWQQVGDPYAWGGNGPDRFDCSGLVYYAFNRAGRRLDDMSAQSLAMAAVPVSEAHLRAGDLVFFKYPGSARVGHVGIFVAEGMMVHAPNRRSVVRLQAIDTAMGGANVFYGRLP